MKASIFLSSLVAAGFFLGGCGGDDDDDAKHAEYTVTVTNLTHAQPFSPLALWLHTADVMFIQAGEQAGSGLEYLAEGGDNSLLLAEAEAMEGVEASSGGAGLILPGGSESVTLAGTEAPCIGLAAMLVNTNDGFVGADCIGIGDLEVGGAVRAKLVAYDAGTEANSESAASVPGPAGGGEGYSAVRDDRNFVAVHGGAVTADDGLSTSALSYAHRWDNPVASVIVRRVR